MSCNKRNGLNGAATHRAAAVKHVDIYDVVLGQKYAAKV
jgi:hypothetical protein